MEDSIMNNLMPIISKISVFNDAVEALDEAQESLNEALAPIVEAMCNAKIGGEEIKSIGQWPEHGIDYFHIDTEYYSHGGGTTTYKIPVQVMAADDPLAEAKAWNNTKQILENESRKRDLRKQIESLEKIFSGL